MGGPERIYQVRDGRLVHRTVDPKYVEAGQELLRRVEEGKVRVREYTGYHQQEIMDVRGHVEGHELVEAAAGGATVATAPACGGSALLWSRDGGANLLSPAGGGVEIVNRHKDLERPDFTEYEVVDSAAGRITLRAAKPRAVWGPQTQERVSVERVLQVDGEGLTLEQTFRVEKQPQEITPAVRVALPLASPITVTAGEYSGSVTLPTDQTEAVLELPEKAREGTRSSYLQRNRLCLSDSPAVVEIASSCGLIAREKQPFSWPFTHQPKSALVSRSPSNLR